MPWRSQNVVDVPVPGQASFQCRGGRGGDGSLRGEVVNHSLKVNEFKRRADRAAEGERSICVRFVGSAENDRSTVAAGVILSTGLENLPGSNVETESLNLGRVLRLALRGPFEA